MRVLTNFLYSHRAGALFCLLFAFDRATKVFALFFFSDHRYPLIEGVIEFSLTINTKHVFLAQGTITFLAVAALFFLLMCVWLASKKAARKDMSVWALILSAGAVSNFFDIIRYQGILDWIALGRVTVLNISDIYILIGCAVLARSFFTQRKKG